MNILPIERIVDGKYVQGGLRLMRNAVFIIFLNNLKNKTVLNELISRLENMEYGCMVNMEERIACMEQ